MTLSKDITQLLKDWSNGNESALEVLMPMVYQELHQIARRQLFKEQFCHSIQPTELVNEAYLKIIDQSKVSWQNRAHFYAIASIMMRRILINHINAKLTDKRGGDITRLALNEELVMAKSSDVDIMVLDQALNRLACIDERKAKIIEYRFFGGLKLEEIAEILNISLIKVKREWRAARAWLYVELK